MRVLFISYDGLTDPLGQSQILPYLTGLHGDRWQFIILSFEKPQRFAQTGQSLARRLASQGILWYPLSFTARPRILAKAWDLARMHWMAFWIALRHKVSMVHCRSYQAGQVGLWLQRLFSTKMIFDMRGLWADERVDGGMWNLDHPFQRRLYQSYRRLETRMLAKADFVITLTSSSLPVLQKRCAERALPITVIPCCADFEHFRPATTEQRRSVRCELGLKDELVVGYLGSLGTWYMHQEMFLFYRVLLAEYPESHFLCLTLDWNEAHESCWQAAGLSEFRHRLHLRSAGRDQVPYWLGAVDLALSFIKPAFSKIASSPTKVAELLAMGVPVIANTGVGDVPALLSELRGGHCLSDFSPQEMQRAVKAVPALLSSGGPELRQRARPQLDLPLAHQRYREVYCAIG